MHETPHPPTAHVTPLDNAVCIVIDSNIWVDILIFDDPVTRPIADALASGRLQAIIDAPCFDEIAYVLNYPQFAKYAIDQEDALAKVRRWTRLLNAPTSIPAPSPTLLPIAAVLPEPGLPRCSDRDDQKFLELAHAGNARWLLTKDKALLKLSRRLQRDFGCRIDRPAVFTATLNDAVVPPLRHIPQIA